MKEIVRKIVFWKLNTLAKLYIWRFKPTIIAITGNTGKTSTKEAVGAVLKSIKNVRVSGGNLNNEFGVPMTILGDWQQEYYNNGSSVSLWFKIITAGLFGLIASRNYPEVLVMEYGADRPGDIKKLSKMFRPDIGIITAIGEIPVHVEFFSGPEALAREKARLVEALKPEGYAVLNYDDDAVLDMREKTRAKVMTFGFGEEANVRLSNFVMSFNNDDKGETFKINYSGNNFVPVKISGSLGKSQAWASGAAAAVGIIFGMNLANISEQLGKYDSPPGRLKILKGIKDSWIIDDTYNASPASTHLALDTIKEIPAKRKIVVLGDMLELGKYTIKAHQDVGSKTAEIADILVCVGDRAKFIAEAASDQMDQSKIFKFETSDEAKTKVQELIEERDLILVKGSQGMRMEKIVEEIMAEPENKKELLVRQSKKWLNK